MCGVLAGLALLVVCGVAVGSGAAAAATVGSPVVGASPSPSLSTDAGSVHTLRGPSGVVLASDSRVTFGIEPASSTGPDGRDEFSFGADPGGVIFDDAAVLNYSTSPLVLQIYATDAVETSNGGFGLLAVGQKPTGVGAWTTIPAGDTAVSVPPATATGPGVTIVPITVRVPKGTSPGDHAGALVASLQTVGTSSSGHIILNQRVGTRIFIQVSGKLHASLSIVDLQAAYHGTANPLGSGSVGLRYQVRNTGNVDLGVSLSVLVDGPVGPGHQVDLGKISILLPGATVDERALVGDLWPAVRLTASVTASPTVIGSTNSRSLTPVTASVPVWALPLPLGGVALILIVAVGAPLALRRRRRRRALRVTTAPERTLVDV